MVVSFSAYFNLELNQVMRLLSLLGEGIENFMGLEVSFQMIVVGIGYGGIVL